MIRPRPPRRDVSGILLLDKPPGLSSNEALQRAKRLYQASKAGHTGSLDPLATGVLPICFGAATKLSGVLLESDKSYLARARLGERTTTGDAEGPVVERSDAAISREQLQAVLPQFLGTIEQIPPMYSALKHEGRPLYQLARQGVEVERAARTVTIHELVLEGFDSTGFELFVRCSKGTYVRTLIEDLARAAGQCAHLLGLRRTAVEPFGGLAFHTFERLEAAAAEGGVAALDALLLRPAEGLRHWPQLRIDPVRAGYLAHGQAVRVAGVQRRSRLAVLDESGELLGLAEATDDGMVTPRRWLAAAESGPHPACSGAG